jgi:hypothetical protein
LIRGGKSSSPINKREISKDEKRRIKGFSLIYDESTPF